MGGEGGYPDPDDPGPPFTAVADVTFFDNVQPITKVEVIADEGFESATEHLMSDVEGDPTRVRYHFDGGTYTDLRMPNARRGTGLVLRDNADMLVNDEGTLEEDTQNGPHPGVAIRFQHTADGSINATVRTNPACAAGPDPREGETSDHAPAPTYVLKCTSTYFGTAIPESDQPAPPTSDPLLTTVEPVLVDIDIVSESELLSGNGPCACNADAVNQASMSTASVDQCTGKTFDYLNGNGRDSGSGNMFSGAYVGPDGVYVPGWGDGGVENLGHGDAEREAIDDPSTPDWLRDWYEARLRAIEELDRTRDELKQANAGWAKAQATIAEAEQKELEELQNLIDQIEFWLDDDDTEAESGQDESPCSPTADQAWEILKEAWKHEPMPWEWDYWWSVHPTDPPIDWNDVSIGYGGRIKKLKDLWDKARRVFKKGKHERAQRPDESNPKRKINGVSVTEAERACMGRDVFQGNAKGLERAIQAVRSGQYRLPPGITRGTLRRFKRIAKRAVESGRDSTGIQARRIQLVDEILQQRGW